MGLSDDNGIESILCSRFKRLCESDLSDSADFLVVYIEEAHPAEKKHYLKQIDIETHKSLDDRISAAENLIKESCDDGDDEDFPAPIVVDTMDNEANHAYGALPDRLYIVKDGKIAYVGGQGPYGYNLKETEERLRELIGGE